MEMRNSKQDIRNIDSLWTEEEQAFLAQLDSPWKIQEYLDSIPYNTDHQTRSPRRVMRDGKAHCMEGALFAAAALYFHGQPPLILDLKAVNDDDHVIAIYRIRGLIGAIAKSNFSLLRFREPIYRNYRELALSYFELYYNMYAERTLRAYSRPLDLRIFDPQDWMTTEEDLAWISQRLDALRHYPLVDEITAQNLQPVDDLLYQAGLLGSDLAGLYKP
ncbi:MAG: hypothetical protein H5T63_03545, partial [Chloroflexi bacterium]|nr:hypothetical protein [Chloroflexota bacterium]